MNYNFQMSSVSSDGLILNLEKYFEREFSSNDKAIRFANKLCKGNIVDVTVGKMWKDGSCFQALWSATQ